MPYHTDLTIDDSDFSSNTTGLVGTNSGVILNHDILVFNNTTFEDNHGKYVSVLYSSGDSVTMNNCRVENNSSDRSSYGAIFLYGSSSSVAELYSVNTTWDDNTNYDILVSDYPSSAVYTAGSTTTFECSTSSVSCE